MYKLRIENLLRVVSFAMGLASAIALIALGDSRHFILALILIPATILLFIFACGGLYRMVEMVEGIRDFLFEHVDEA